jgi:hypothetical protein
MTLLWTLLIGVASYRIYRLIAEDSITEHYRDWVLVRSPAWVDAMVSCAWCLGSTLTFAVTWLTDIAIGLQAPVLVALAAAVVVGWLGEHL